MSRGAAATVLATAVLAAIAVSGLTAPPARAASPGGVLCTLTGLVSGALGKVCDVATHAGQVVGAGKQLLGGHLGGALSKLTGSGAAHTVATAVGLSALAGAVILGARYLLEKTASVIGATTRPDLTSAWFSASYWRVAAIAALLTVPFLCGAAVQALLRGDVTLLLRAAFGYLPLAMLAIGIAAPVTMLLLSASDEMSSLVAAASGHAGADFLGRAGGLSLLFGLGGRTVFITFFVGLLTAAATLALWVELLVRAAAVDVIVLMLPLFFAAMVWPARRMWAVRAVELLIALILSKFAIVAVLSLGGAAMGHTLISGPASVLTGATLVGLAAFSPWALMRLLPLGELAGAAAAGLSPAKELPRMGRGADGGADAAEDRLPATERTPRSEPAEVAAGEVGAGEAAGGEAAGGEVGVQPALDAAPDPPALPPGGAEPEPPGGDPPRGPDTDPTPGPGTDPTPGPGTDPTPGPGSAATPDPRGPLPESLDRLSLDAPPLTLGPDQPT